MERKEAEDLLKHYDNALFEWYRDKGDHPHESEKKRVAIARLKELLIKELTDNRMPIR